MLVSHSLPLPAVGLLGARTQALKWPGASSDCSHPVSSTSSE